MTCGFDYRFRYLEDQSQRVGKHRILSNVWLMHFNSLSMKK